MAVVSNIGYIAMSIVVTIVTRDSYVDCVDNIFLIKLIRKTLKRTLIPVQKAV